MVEGCVGGYVGCCWCIGSQTLVKNIAKTFQGCDQREIGPMTTNTESLDDPVFVYYCIGNECLPYTRWAEDDQSGDIFIDAINNLFDGIVSAVYLG